MHVHEPQWQTIIFLSSNNSIYLLVGFINFFHPFPYPYHHMCLSLNSVFIACSVLFVHVLSLLLSFNHTIWCLNTCFLLVLIFFSIFRCVVVVGAADVLATCATLGRFVRGANKQIQDAKDLHHLSLVGSYGAHLLHGFPPHFLHPTVTSASSVSNPFSSSGGAFVKPFPSNLPLPSAFAPPSKCVGLGLEQVSTH